MSYFGLGVSVLAAVMFFFFFFKPNAAVIGVTTYQRILTSLVRKLYIESVATLSHTPHFVTKLKQKLVGCHLPTAGYNICQLVLSKCSKR